MFSLPVGGRVMDTITLQSLLTFGTTHTSRQGIILFQNEPENFKVALTRKPISRIQNRHLLSKGWCHHDSSIFIFLVCTQEWNLRQADGGLWKPSPSVLYIWHTHVLILWKIDYQSEPTTAWTNESRVHHVRAQCLVSPHCSPCPGLSVVV